MDLDEGGFDEPAFIAPTAATGQDARLRIRCQRLEVRSNAFEGATVDDRRHEVAQIARIAHPQFRILATSRSHNAGHSEAGI